MRSNIMDAARRAQTSSSRASIREIDDDHLMQEIKTADVYHSETATGFENPQPLGFTCVAMPQDKEQQQQQQKGQQGGGGQGGGPDWNNNQPKGPSSEGIVSYANGSRSHPVMTSLDDRRVRPYGQKAGEGQFYDPAGSGQTIYHRNRDDGKDGLYVLTLDDQQQLDGVYALEWRDGQQPKSRTLYIRHANKKRQRRKKQQQQGGQRADGGDGQDGGSLPDDSKSGYKHEGDSVNTEMRLDSNEMHFYDGGTKVGYFNRGKKRWVHYPTGDEAISMHADKDHVSIHFGGMHIWVDKGGCWSSKPIQIKDDPYQPS